MGARPSTPSRACASPTCSTPRSAGTFRGLYVQGEDIAQSDPNTQHVEAALRAMDLVVVQDLFLNETARFAHVFLPGTSFLEKDGTFTNAERRINRVRPVFAVQGRQGRVGDHLRDRPGDGLRHVATPPRRRSWTRSRRPPRRSPASRSRGSTRSARCSGRSTTPPRPGTPIMHVGEFVRGKGKLVETVFVPTTERSHAQVPADPHHRPDPQPVQRRRPDPAYRQQHLAPRGRPRDPPRRRRGARHLHRRPGRPVQPGRVDDAARRWCRSGCRPASSTRPSTTR